MTIDVDFRVAAESVKNLKKTPSNDEILETYALYKQITVGDNNTEKPGLFDFKGKAKWDAWNSKKGMFKSDAMQKYVNLVKTLQQKYN